LLIPKESGDILLNFAAGDIQQSFGFEHVHIILPAGLYLRWHARRTSIVKAQNVPEPERPPHSFFTNNSFSAG
jgi:hypothetical protein